MAPTCTSSCKKVLALSVHNKSIGYLGTLGVFTSFVLSPDFLDVSVPSLSPFLLDVLSLASLPSLASSAFSTLPFSASSSTDDTASIALCSAKDSFSFAVSASDASLSYLSTVCFLPIASNFSFIISTSGNAHGSRCFASIRALASSFNAFTNVSVMSNGGMRFAVKVVPTSSNSSASPSTKEVFFSFKNVRTAKSSAIWSGVKSSVTDPTVTFRCTAVPTAFVSNTVFPCSAISIFFSTAPVSVAIDSAFLFTAFPPASWSETTDSAFLCIVLPLASSPSATCG